MQEGFQRKNFKVRRSKRQGQRERKSYSPKTAKIKRELWRDRQAWVIQSSLM